MNVLMYAINTSFDYYYLIMNPITHKNFQEFEITQNYFCS